MSLNETVILTDDGTGSGDWQEASDGTHRSVTITADGNGTFKVRLQDAKPAFADKAIGGGRGDSVRVENAGQKIWVFISQSDSVIVQRGCAKVVSQIKGG